MALLTRSMESLTALKQQPMAQTSVLVIHCLILQAGLGFTS